MSKITEYIRNGVFLLGDILTSKDSGKWEILSGVQCLGASLGGYLDHRYNTTMLFILLAILGTLQISAVFISLKFRHVTKLLCIYAGYGSRCKYR